MPHGSPASSYRLEAVKICGTTNAVDRDLSADAGADYFGVLVDVAYSRRSLTSEQATPLFDSPPIPGIALLFNPTMSKVESVVQRLDPYAIQFLGNESPEFIAQVKSELDCEVWKSLHVPARSRGSIDMESIRDLAQEYEDSGVDSLILNTVDTSDGTAKFGTGIVGDWGLIRGLMKGLSAPGILAGGLTPDNVVAALEAVKPVGIDICSGVESAPGKKDPRKLKQLMEAFATFRSDEE